MNEQLPIPLPISNEIGLPERAHRIRSLVNVVRGCIIEVGRELIAAKAELPHGEWLPWLEREFGWDERTARRYMQVAEAFTIKSDSVSDFTGLTIDATALYALSAPAVPIEVREQAVQEAAAGKRITAEEADRLIAQHVAAAVQTTRAELGKVIEEATSQADAKTEALQAQLAEITAAKDKPGVADAMAMMQKITGKRRLSARQVQALSVALGTSISYGGVIYAPMTDEEAQRADERVRLTGALIRALTFFASEAMPPADLLRICPDYVRANIAKLLPGALIWLETCSAVLKELENGHS